MCAQASSSTHNIEMQSQTPNSSSEYDVEKQQNVKLGTYIFLGILLTIHVACWIASLIKAVLDRKALRRKTKRSNDEALLGETHRKEEEEERKRSKLNNESGVKFAITDPNKPPPVRQNYRQQGPTQTSPSGHYFPKRLQQILSTGGAKRIGPEELAKMLDSYGEQFARSQRNVTVHQPVNA